MGRRRAVAQVVPARSFPPPPSPASPSPLLVSLNTPTSADRAAPAPVTLPTRRQPVVLSVPARSRRSRRSRRARCAEVAGGTAADCAAVCCCCPCGIVNLLVFAVVKVPAGLCRRALLKQKKKVTVAAASRMRKGGGVLAGNSGGATMRGLLEPMVGVAGNDDDDEFIVFRGAGPVVVGPGAKGLLVGTAVGWPAEMSPSAEVSEFDKEMWAHFYGAGFWRSPSQRET